MGLVSTYPAAKAAVVALLQNAIDSADAPVFWGLPGSIGSRDYITLGDMSGTQIAVVLNGQRLPRDEEYDLDATIVSARGTGGQQAATERVFELAGVLEQELRGDPTLGDLVAWAVVGGMTLDESVAEDGQASAVLVVSVAIRARVQGA